MQHSLMWLFTNLAETEKADDDPSSVYLMLDIP
jgi:hypothetical protein